MQFITLVSGVGYVGCHSKKIPEPNQTKGFGMVTLSISEGQFETARNVLFNMKFGDITYR